MENQREGWRDYANVEKKQVNRKQILFAEIDSDKEFKIAWIEEHFPHI